MTASQHTFPVGDSEAFRQGLPATGSLVGRWRIGEQLGEGAMGVVFEATHAEVGRPVAIKFLRPELLGNSEATARFFREARVAGLTDHEGIARVIDFEVSENMPLLVMERLQGASLDELMAAWSSGRRAEHLELLVGVLETLAFIHQQGFVHRDLKPANIFRVPLSDGGFRSKILDFGIAKPHRSSVGGFAEISAEAAIVGTAGYMSPEQAGAGAVGPASDLWSVGVMAYEIAAGSLPFEGENLVDMLFRVVTQHHAPATAVEPNLPPAFDAFFERALAKDADDRFPDAIAMARALRDLAIDVRAIDGEPVNANPAGRNGMLPVLTGPVQLDLSDSAMVRAPVPTSTIGPTTHAAPARRRGLFVAAALCLLSAAAIWAAVSWVGTGSEAATARPVGDDHDLVALHDPLAVGGEPVRLVWTPYGDRALLAKRATWVAETISRTIGRSVLLTIPPTYERTLSLIEGGGFDLANLPAASYVLAAQDDKLHLLARQSVYGGVGYQSVIVSKSDGGPTTIAELEGGRICYVDRHSTSGFLLAAAMLKEAGITPAQTRWSGAHSAALDDLFAGECDAAAVTENVLQTWLEPRDLSLGALRLLATSEPIPGDALAARGDLPAALEHDLERAAMVLINQTRGGHVDTSQQISGFLPATAGDYDGIRELVMH